MVLRIFSLFFLLSLSGLQAQDMDALRRIAADPSQSAPARWQAMNALGRHMNLSASERTPDSLAQLYQQAVARQNLPDMALAITLQGGYDRQRKAYAKALGHYEEGLKHYTQLGDSLGKARTLLYMGMTYSDQGNFEQALRYYQQGLPLFEGLEKQAGLASVLQNIGAAHLKQFQYTQALSAYQRSLGIYEKLPNQRPTALVLRDIGRIYLSRGEFPEAIGYFKQSLSLFEQLGDRQNVANVQNSLASIYQARGEYEQALEEYQRNVAIYQANGNELGRAISLYNMGIIRYNQGDYAQALTHYQKSLQISEDIGDPIGVAALSGAIGTIYAQQGDYEKGLTFFQQSLQVSKAISDPDGVATALGHLGDLYTLQQQYDKALTHFELSLKMVDSLGHQYDKAGILYNIGNLYWQQQDYAQSLVYTQQSLALYEAIEDQDGIALSLGYIGDIYARQGNWAQAEQYGARALAIAQEIGNLSSVEELASSLYLTYKEQQKYRQALEMHELSVLMRDSLAREDNQRATFRFEYQQKALQDSLATVQQKAETELAYQTQLAQRNYLVLASLGLLGVGILGFLFFRDRQRKQSQRRELALEQQRERQAQLAELDRLKTQFFTNITHEFRTPLTIILGMADQVREAHKRHKQVEGLNLIKRNGKKLLHLINQLLDLAKIDAANLKPQYQAKEVASFVQYVGESFESFAEKKGVRLLIYSEIDELHMAVDPDMLQKIIANLLSNAIKFTPARGKVILHLSRQGERLHLKVKDTGEGITEAELPHIFDRFYQVDHPVNRQGEGTGIGLALVKELVNGLEGDIQVKSQPQRGAEFEVRLPIKAVTASPLSAAHTEPPSLLVEATAGEALSLPITSPVKANIPPDRPRPHLLIVEDNPDVVQYLQSVLQDHYQLQIAANGQEGIEQAIKQVPDILISDVMMPKKNGFELVETLKTDERTSHIPIILLTAKATQQDKIAGFRHGADAYLMKPFDKEELYIRLENLLEVRQTLQQKYAHGMLPTQEVAAPLSVEEQFLLKVQSQIEANYTEPDFGVEPLADALGMSRVQLYRKLKALCDQSPSAMIRSFRLEKALVLLKNPQLNVSEVAYELGYNDPNYFIRQFKQQYGDSPNSYRKHL